MINLEKVTIGLSVGLVCGLVWSGIYIGQFTQKVDNIEEKISTLPSDVRQIQLDVAELKVLIKKNNS